MLAIVVSSLLILRVAAFSFKVFDQFYDWPNSDFAGVTSTVQEVIISFKLRANSGYYFKPTTTTYNNDKYVSDSVNLMDYGYYNDSYGYWYTGNTTGYVKEASSTSETLVFFSFEYVNSTAPPQLRKIVRSNKAVDNSEINELLTPKQFIRYCFYGNRFFHSENKVKYRQSYWGSNSYYLLYDYYGDFSDKILRITRLTTISTESDWNDPNFYRLLLIPTLPRDLSRQSLDAFAFRRAPSNRVTATDSSTTGSLGSNVTYYKDRLSDQAGIGVKLRPGQTITTTISDSNCVDNGWTIGAHFDLHDLAALYLNPLENVTLALKVMAGNTVGNQTVTEFKASFSFTSSGILAIQFNLVSTHTKDNEVLATVTDYRLTGKSFTSFPNGGTTVFMTAHFTYYEYPSQANDVYTGTAIGLVQVYPQIFDALPTTIPPPLRYWVRASGSHPSDDRAVRGKVSAHIWAEWPSTNAVLSSTLVRLRVIDNFFGLPDFTAFESQYPQTVFSSAAGCFNPTLIALQQSLTKWCEPRFTIRNNWDTPPSVVTNCQMMQGYSSYCEFCKPGYGADYVNLRGASTSATCIPQANCTYANYMSWIPSVKAPSTISYDLCLSCKWNCYSCDITGDCLTCNPNSTLTTITNATGTSKLCICNKPGCDICENLICDQCKPWNSNSGYIMHIDTVNTDINCFNRTKLECDIGYGVKNIYNWPTYSSTIYPVCTSCLVPNCYNCSNNAATCLQCHPGYSLINFNLADGAEYRNEYVCSDNHTIYAGLVENVTGGVYVPCVYNCDVCDLTNVAINCTKCAANYWYSVREKYCVLNSSCTNGDYGLYSNISEAEPWCYPCQTNCMNCTNNTECIQCYSGYRYYITNKSVSTAYTCVPTSTCGIPTKTYTFDEPRPDGLIQRVCRDCLPLCTYCINGTTCLRCDPNYYYQPENRTCITIDECLMPSLVPAYFNDTSASVLTCGKCIDKCVNCSSKTMCNLCDFLNETTTERGYFHLERNECIEKAMCTEGINSFDNGTLCRYCKTNCKSCSNLTNCWQGITSEWMIDTDGSTVIKGCRIATTKFNDTHCIDCPANCTKCAYDPNNTTQNFTCQQCNSSYYVNETNYCERCNQLGQFLNPKDSRCYLCHVEYCDYCNTTTECIGCKNPYFYQPIEKKCLTATQCTDIYESYLVSPSQYPTCLPCGRNCTKCNETSSCTQCRQSTVDIGQTRLYHIENNDCIHPSACTSEIDSFPSGPFCKFCKPNCKWCSNLFNCWKCKDGYILDLDQSTCIPACPPMSTPKNTTNCIACPDYCQECTYSTSTRSFTCSKCVQDTMFNERGQCTTCTQTGFVKTINQDGDPMCKRCIIENCVKCINSPTECAICEHLFYVTETKSCQVCSPPLVYTAERRCLFCKVENCKTCNKYDLERCDECEVGYGLDFMKQCESRSFNISTYRFNLASLRVRVSFEHDVLDIDLSNVQMWAAPPGQDSNKTNLDIKYFHRDSDKRNAYLIDIASLPSQPELILKLVFVDVFKVMSANKKDFFLSQGSKEITFSQISRYIPMLESAKASSQIISSGASVVLAVGSVISFNYALVMLKIYQMMDFMLLYNVEYPYNFQKFIDNFKTADPLIVIPDVLKPLYDDTCAEMGDKFITSEMGCQFLSNCHTSVLILICFVTLRLVVFGLSHCFRNNKGRLCGYLHRLREGILGTRGMFTVITMFDVDFHLGAFTNSKFYAGDKVRTIQNIGNNLLAITFVYCYPAIIVYYLKKTRQMIAYQNIPDETEQAAAILEFKKKYEFLLDGRKNDSLYAKYLDVFNMTRNYLICMLVVGFYDNPYIQITSTFFLVCLTLFLEIRHRPNTIKMVNIVNIAVWTFYTLLSLCFLITKIMSSSMTKESVYAYIGYPMVLLFSLLVFTNILPVLIESTVAAITAVKKLRAKCQKKPEEAKLDKEQGKDLHTPEIQENANLREQDAIIRPGPASMNANPIPGEPQSNIESVMDSLKSNNQKLKTTRLPRKNSISKFKL